MAIPARSTRLARCPHCTARVRIASDSQLGDRLMCPECNTMLEVVALSPAELYWAFDPPDDDDGDQYGNGDLDWETADWEQWEEDWEDNIDL